MEIEKDSKYVITDDLSCALSLEACHNDYDCGTCGAANEYRNRVEDIKNKNNAGGEHNETK